MKRLKNVTRTEKIHEILKTLEHNSDALDYVRNEIFRFDNMLKYNSEDYEVANIFKILKYIEFSLNYLDDCYNKSLDKLGYTKMINVTSRCLKNDKL